jgi:hypothetical protein
MLTIRLPGVRLYIVNTPPLAQAVQKEPTTLAMPPLEAKAMMKILNLSKPTHKTIMENIYGGQGDWGFMFMFYKTVHPPLAAASTGLDAMNKTSVRQVEQLLNSIMKDGDDKMNRYRRGFFTLVRE